MYDVGQNFELPVTLYYNKETKKYLQKFLKMKLVGITSDLEEVGLGSLKIDMGHLGNKLNCMQATDGKLDKIKLRDQDNNEVGIELDLEIKIDILERATPLLKSLLSPIPFKASESSPIKENIYVNNRKYNFHNSVSNSELIR